MLDGRDAPPGVPAPVVILHMLTGKWVSQAITVAARLGIADHLAQGAGTVEALAERTGAHLPSLRRLLRALASVGVFAEASEGRFANTPLSEVLRTEIPGSMRSMAILYGDHPTWDAWGELLHCIRTGRSGFKKAHGVLPFEYLAQNPDAARSYNEAMTGFSAQEVQAIHQAINLSAVHTLVDVGGGHGTLLCSSLHKYPHQRGILFDQPGVIATAAAVVATSGIAPRCELVAGNFFESVPSVGDGYLLKHILHDWKDEDAAAILRTVRRAMRPDARLFVIDAVIEPGNDPSFAKLLDLEMLVLYDSGRERTRSEFTDLFRASGFELVRVVPTQALPCILEAKPV